MIGSHDSMTYLKSTSVIYNNCKRWWKTQCKSLKDQYASGVRMFDIRVHRDGKMWQPCHGKVNLKGVKWSNISDICQEFKENYPEAIYRIVLEKGNSKDENRFKTECKCLFDMYDNFWRADIRKSGSWMGSVGNNNQKLYDAGYLFAKVNTWENPAHEVHGILTAGNAFRMDLRKAAQQINKEHAIFDEGFIKEWDGQYTVGPAMVQQASAIARKIDLGLRFDPATQTYKRCEIDLTAIQSTPSTKKTSKGELWLIDYSTNEYK